MSLSLKFPTSDEKAKMLQDNDKVSLFFMRVAKLLFIFSSICVIVTPLSYILGWAVGYKWGLIANIIGWPLTAIALVIFSETRGTFIYKKQEKDKIEQKLRLDRINEKTEACFGASKDQIEKRYVDEHFHTNKTGKPQLKYNRFNNSCTIEPEEKYEIGEILTINFEDLKDIELDKEIRKLCFDKLIECGFLQERKKYAEYIFDRRRHPDLLEKHNVKHSIDRFVDK
jgi:hypothetical protein